MNRKACFILAAALCMAGSMAVSPQKASAGEAKIELKEGTTMRDVLAGRTGKRTTLRMQSGEEIEGTVVLVGDSLVHMTKLAGREFYDAVVDTGRISAVIVRVRSR